MAFKMKQLVVGILAHVDAGKTTLSEGMLYTCGNIRKLGRVDRKDAFLDTYAQERERGITIFSKQALLTVDDTQITLLDTPGHVDFSAEMERTLQVLDYAILVISGSDGVQGHTFTLWKLLARYHIPVFLFVNKMDQPGTDKDTLLRQLKDQLGGECVDFTNEDKEAFYEELAVCEEKQLDEFLKTGEIHIENISRMIRERKVFPCYFGSALKLEGVEELIAGLNKYTREQEYPTNFGARVFKITHDIQGARLTHLKVTGGVLKVRETLSGICRAETGNEKEDWTEKVNQLRIYSGDKYDVVNEVEAGRICAVAGLSKTWSGEGLGSEEGVLTPVLEPVLSYSILLPEDVDAALMLPKLRRLEEEEPQLHIVWDEKNKEIKAQIMGQVQTEILTNLIEERFGVKVSFGEGSIVYKETIANTVEGVGHFEPLRHYAEVHLLMEPGEPGSGLQFVAKCSEDELDKNWQRLVLTHLEEKEHIGVLTGSSITDMKITLVAGRAHLKHTEGGDFRQATYRALRQGLMQAECVLLEPWYDFKLEIPQSVVGHAMTDLDKRKASFELEQKSNDVAVLTGAAPMALMQDYQREVASYSRGMGLLTCSLKGYFPCHNTQEVMDRIDYSPYRDLENPTSSVFCAHGAGFVVEWEEVENYMHLDSMLKMEKPEDFGAEAFDIELSGSGARASLAGRNSSKSEERWLGIDEVDDLLRSATHANRKEGTISRKEGWKRSGKRNIESLSTSSETRVYKPVARKEQYLLVDGYNVIFAWDDLKELAEINLDGARGKLLDILCNYQAVKQYNLIVVFDAYRVAGHPTEYLDYHNIHVVYTKEAETADRYIERFAHENAHKYDVTVATSDGLEQVIVVGEGCQLISAREFKEEIERSARQVLEDFESKRPVGRNYLESILPTQAAKELEAFTNAPKTDK